MLLYDLSQAHQEGTLRRPCRTSCSSPGRCVIPPASASRSCSLRNPAPQQKQVFMPDADATPIACITGACARGARNASDDPTTVGAAASDQRVMLAE